jgi:hypothetical protein
MRRSTFLGVPRLIVLGAVVLLVAGGSYAFTASNTVSQSPAGEGESSSLSGYTASSVVWSPDAANPANVHQVSFSLSTVTASTSVYAGADNGSTIQWSNTCTQGTISSGSATETCVFGTEPPASGVTKLAVSAAN